MRTKHFVPNIQEIDYISYLLDDHLCSLIVSYLPFEEAVATSILSKRWQYVYASSPCLDFDFSLFRQARARKQAFVDFVDRTLQLFSGSELKRFRLSMENYGGYEPRVEDWVKFAVEHEVQELELGLPKGRLIKIPDIVFQCGSITDLKLRMCDYAFELPLPLGLKNLKSLEIKSVSFVEGEFFKGVFENCLVLEEVVIEGCKIDVIEIEGEKIKKLSICNCYWIDRAQMKVSAPNLRCFSYIGTIADSHCLENLTSLVEVVLNLSAPSVSSDEESLTLFMELAQMLRNAKVLTLSPWCIEQFPCARKLPKCVQAQGENVKDLVLLLQRREDCVQVVAPLIMSCVNMPSRSLRRGVSCDGGRGRCDHKMNMKGTMKCLKSVKLEYIDENKTGLEMVKFLLKNADELEKLIIVPSKDGLDLAKFKRKVAICRKASRKAMVEYCMPS